MKNIFIQRRKKLIKPYNDSIFLIPSSSHKRRSHDTEYPFRQDSNFYYLTGFDEPHCLLILSQKKGKIKSTLFVRPKDAFSEMWAGRRSGPEKAKKDLKIDEVHSIEELHKLLPSLLDGHLELFIDFFEHQKLFEEVKKAVHGLTMKKKIKSHVPVKWNYITPVIGKMRLIKDKEEIAYMKKANQITKKAHEAAMAFSRPGKNESEVNALLNYIFNKEGGNGQAYENIVASGDNANILHYIENNHKMNRDDLLLIDAGCQYNYYASDVTRTFPVSGKFTEVQKEIYQIVLDSQIKAIKAVRPGATLNKIHEVASKVLIKGLIKLGLLKGGVAENFKSGKFKKFYPHGTGHWLGLDVHDNSPYLSEGLENIKFKPGMVITVEPGLYFPAHDKKIPKKFRGIGIRIEDDILVTRNGAQNLSEGIPKEIKEVEKACQKDYRSFL